MAEYKEIKGYKIQVTDTDPVVYAGAWSSGGTLNTTRHSAARGTAGIQTAAIATGGSGLTANTEQYNGSAWTEINNLNTARKASASCATSYTALVVAGGANPAPTAVVSVESFDGTNWTEVNDLNAARQQFAGA